MTTREEARRAAIDPLADGRYDPLGVGELRSARERALDREADRNAGGPRLPPLPERLYAARERKGVDLYRAERDTKIRARYLAALERGEYRELPGDVYTKGFLRNYGSYLSLDPEYLIDLYRLETSAGAERPRMPSPPRSS